MTSLPINDDLERETEKKENRAEQPDPENKINKERSQQLKIKEDLIKEQETKYHEGEILTFVRVRFPGNARSFPFLTEDNKLTYGQKVVALSDRGMALGYINSFSYQLPFSRSMLPLFSILKPASEQELQKESDNREEEFEAKKKCEQIIHELKLSMELTHVEFTQFGKKAVFYFTAPERVDFRELVKRLVSDLKMRIELRQIHMRDRTAGLGGIGICGRQLCCSSFLSKYGHASMKMAKNQNLTLAPNKLNGLCCQLKCCLQFEDESYLELKRKLPYPGGQVLLKNGDRGQVEKLHLFQGQFEMLTVEGCRRRYSFELYDPKTSPLTEVLRFDSFDYVRDETQHLVQL